MCKECGIDGYKTNHSLRATAATRLYESGIDEQLVKQKKNVSDILSKKQCNEIELAVKDGIACVPPCVPPATEAQGPSYISKSGAAHYFSSCTNVNINFNTYNYLY